KKKPLFSIWPNELLYGPVQFQGPEPDVRGILSKFENTRSQECPFKLNFTAYKYFPPSALEYRFDTADEPGQSRREGHAVCHQRFVSTQNLTSLYKKSYKNPAHTSGKQTNQQAAV
ncbi:hypothetical protein CIB84_008419, partial [Bambusicola thoracicus]